MSYCIPLLTAFAVIALALSATPGQAESDPEAGAKVFNKKCAACHNVDQKKNKIGPHLVGIFGRKAGIMTCHFCSDAMRNSGIVWSEEKITEFLKNPRGYVKGNQMVFASLREDDDIANLIAYLKQETVKYKHESDAPTIAGTYNVTGTNPNGSRYGGTCTITNVGHNEFEARWNVGTTYYGKGQLVGDTLTINWGAPYPVVYKVQPDGSLHGLWHNGHATETLTRR